MKSIALLTVICALGTPAFAGGDRGSDAGTEFSNSSSSRPVAAESTPDRATPQSFAVQLLGSDLSKHGVTEYDFAVGREVYTVALGSRGGRSMYSLHDEAGHLVVGYTVTSEGVTIFDDLGEVETQPPGEVDLSVMEDYGTAALVLSNPSFLRSYVDRKVAYSGPDEEVQAMPLWVGVVAYWMIRCVEVTVNFDAEGFSGGSVVIDC